MKNGLFKLTNSDLYRAAQVFLVAVVGTTVLLVASKFFLVEGFDLFSADWSTIGKFGLNTAFSSSVSYVVTKLLSDKSGRFLGVGSK